MINRAGGTNIVTNAGTIKNDGAVPGFYRSALYFSGGNTTINNSGTIQTASDSDYAILLNNASNNLTVNILTGSNINGKIRSLGSNNILNIKEEINADSLNTLMGQIDNSVGSWTTKINSGGTLTVASGKTISGAITNDTGTINNSGTISNLSLLSGSVTNAGTISNMSLLGGSVTNSSTISNISLLGGSVTNAGTISNMSLLGGSITNSSTITNASFTAGNITNSGTISALTFANGGAYGNINNTGTMTMNVASQNVDYGNTLSGNGTIIKTGANRLQLTGTSTHSGQFSVNGGELKVNGSTASQVVMADGTIISGTGTIGALTLQSGATLAAGNSIGTLNVSGAINLNAGSSTAIEFNNVVMDKTIATGNIAVNGQAAFSLYNYGADNNFVVSQNILETTGGTVSGTFSSTTIDNANFIVSTDYSNNAVRATISKKLNSSTLDAQLSLQNSIGRMVTKTVTDELNDYNYSKDSKATLWINSSVISSNYGQLANSTPYSVNGILTAAGITKKYQNLDLTAGIFNSQANANRFSYFGKDDTSTNGVVLGVGKNQKLAIGSFYNSMQFGFGAYDSNNTRNVAVNGNYETARSSTKGQFHYINFGTSYNLPVTQTGQLSFSILAGLQQTSNDGFAEHDLSNGNLVMGKSSANTINTELGLGYQDQFAKFLNLPDKSFFKFELTAYQSNLYSKHDAQVNQGNASYMISSKYRQGMVFGGNTYAVLPVNEKTSILAKFSRRQNGTLRDSIFGIEARYQF